MAKEDLIKFKNKLIEGATKQIADLRQKNAHFEEIDKALDYKRMLEDDLRRLENETKSKI